jgi:lipopolysaccharide biosynthesis glycosyltransferase
MYAPHAAALIESIIQYCPEKLDFVIIYCELNMEIQNILLNHFKIKVASLEFVKFDIECLKDSLNSVKAAEHLKGLNTYLRLFSPSLLPEKEHHVIYLDCDIIVQDNLLNILDKVDLTKPICAVTEYDPAYKFKDLNVLKVYEKPFINPWIYEAYWYRTYYYLKLNPTSKYFNDGVLIINLDYWRKNNITEKAIDFLLKNPEKAFSADQDALNHVINGDYCALEPRWNSINIGREIFSNYDPSLFEKEVNEYAILHIAGSKKPWTYMCNPKYQKLYWKYRKNTPWPKVEYKDKTLKKILKKYIYNIYCFFMNISRIIIGRNNFRSLRYYLSSIRKGTIFSKARI